MITEPTICAMRGRNPDDPSERKKSNGMYRQRLEIGGGASNTITSVQKDNLLIEPQILRPKRTEEERARRHIQGDTGARFQAKYMAPANDGCSNTIDTVTKDNLLMEGQVTPRKKYRIRKLTPRECFRLMGVRDKHIDKIQASGVSESQQYKLAGNSIVVDVLFYIYTNLFIENDKPEDTLF